MKITGDDLITLGFTPGPYFKKALIAAQSCQTLDEVVDTVTKLVPMKPKQISLQEPIKVINNIIAQTPEEQENLVKCQESMEILTKTPTIVKAALMPDACPAGPEGTIPVGGVVATKNAIHPGFHSADICCSVAITILDTKDPSGIIDKSMSITHFGGGGRKKSGAFPKPDILQEFENNQFLKGLEKDGHLHFGTQGDGNHFLFLGRLRSNGSIAVITHHGSRKPGAMLYKRGMEAAKKYTETHAPDVLPQNSWIPAYSEDGIEYWKALQIIRKWTKGNHFAIHNKIVERTKNAIVKQFWNEHNFIFKRKGLFYHAKGATPAWNKFSEDSSGLTLIPLNMSEPVLIVSGLDNDNGLGFSPHGAGRNYSRSDHYRKLGEHDIDKTIEKEIGNLDIRFWTGTPDLSELPSAYKSAKNIQNQIEYFGLANIVDFVDPIGCIMAGGWNRNKNNGWKKKKGSQAK